MFTSNFSYTGPGRIAICRFVYPQYRAGTKVYQKLAPGPWFKDKEYSNNQALFRKRYFEEILQPLNPHQVYDELLEKAEGHPPVLLCYEKDVANPADWCHRRMAAEWFEKSLGFQVPELALTPAKPILQPSFFD